MKRVACFTGLLIATAMAASPLVAQEPVREREHVVRRGDTLWDLAAYYFSDPFQWPTIYQANTSVVEDPHWIYPDEVLIIPGIRGDTEPSPRVAVQPYTAPLRTVFYRAPVVTTSSTDSSATVLSEPAPVRTPVRTGEFNSAPYVGDPDDLHVLGRYLGAIRENRNVGGAPTAHVGDEVFFSYESRERPEIGQDLQLIEVGEHLAGGRVLEPTGVARVTRLEDEVLFARIEAQYAPIARGQLLATMPVFPEMAEQAHPVESDEGYDLEGRVIEFVGDPPMPKNTDLAFVNLGADDGVEVGDVFTAYLPRRASRRRGAGDFLSRVEELPPENVARLRVVRVGEDVATVRVEQVMLPRLENGIRVRRTHRIQ